MLCKAILDGYLRDKYIFACTENIYWDEAKPLPSWLIQMENIQDAEIIEDPVEVIDVPIVNEVVDELLELRKEAKVLGYKSFHNAGEKKLRNYIAKNK